MDRTRVSLFYLIGYTLGGGGVRAEDYAQVVRRDRRLHRSDGAVGGADARGDRDDCNEDRAAPDRPAVSVDVARSGCDSGGACRVLHRCMGTR